MYDVFANYWREHTVYYFHPLGVSGPIAKPGALKVSINHFRTRLSLFIHVTYEARFEGNFSFIAEKLVLTSDK